MLKNKKLIFIYIVLFLIFAIGILFFVKRDSNRSIFSEQLSSEKKLLLECLELQEKYFWTKINTECEKQGRKDKCILEDDSLVGDILDGSISRMVLKEPKCDDAYDSAGDSPELHEFIEGRTKIDEYIEDIEGLEE